jgi:hypothetical protein
VALGVAEPHPTSTAAISTATIVARRREAMMGTHRNRTVTLQRWPLPLGQAGVIVQAVP